MDEMKMVDRMLGLYNNVAMVHANEEFFEGAQPNQIPAVSMKLKRHSK